jgi:hypothetical protein
VASTVKVLAGILFMPLTWLIVAGLVYYFVDWKWAITVITAFIRRRLRRADYTRAAG